MITTQTAILCEVVLNQVHEFVYAIEDTIHPMNYANGLRFVVFCCD